jgi:hypothetical protein
MKEISLVEEEKEIINQAMVNIFDKYFSEDDLINHLIWLETEGFKYETVKLRKYYKKRFNKEL